MSSGARERTPAPDSRLAQGAARSFPPQVDGDLVRDGVCGVLIAEKLGVSQPTRASTCTSSCARGCCAKRIKQWTFYKRDEAAIRAAKAAIAEHV